MTESALQLPSTFASMFRRKIQTAGALMLVSEILIALFVLRWLQSEYSSEKEQLQKNLFAQFMAARSQVMDSVISKKFIEPILGNPKGFKIHTVEKRGPAYEGDSAKLIITGEGPSVFTQDCVKIKLSTAQDTSLPHEANFELKMESDTSGDLLYRGVKLFITRVGGPHGEGEFFEKHVLSGDTAMLKNFFSENLRENHLDLKTSWVTNHSSKGIPPAPFYYETEFFDHPYGVVIEKYDAFLFRKITPQLLFALLLMLTTGAAFIFSFRSLRNQLRLSAMKDEFISNMSHELKTPVATMKVAVEAMQQMDPVEKKETMREYLGMTAQELTRLDQLVNKVMSSMAMENGNNVFHFEMVDLKSLVEKTIQSLRLQLDQSNATVRFICDDSEVPVRADALHVQGILYNLFDNSLKYGNQSPEISIRLFQSEKEVLLSFKDHGPGIPEEYLDKVFEKFFRVPSGNQHNVKGFGLGLNYVAQVMKHHGGSVSVKNPVEGGCEFNLKFPKM